MSEKALEHIILHEKYKIIIESNLPSPESVDVNDDLVQHIFRITRDASDKKGLGSFASIKSATKARSLAPMDEVALNDTPDVDNSEKIFDNILDYLSEGHSPPAPSVAEASASSSSHQQVASSQS